jgi:aminoglycoside phosphotransferase family enzyme/predicted kinase
MSEATASSDLNTELLRFLTKAKSYSHNPESVEHIQTHISHVFIVPPYVYKLKKAVDFGFLDYSTLEKRHKYCRREVELNRRLCEDTYLGVVGIVKEDRQFSIESEDTDVAPVLEYMVKMRKLPEQYFLHHYIEDNSLNKQHLDRVAETLTTFYKDQRDQELAKWGSIETIQVNTDENFSQTESFIGKTIDRNTFEAVKYFTNSYYKQQEELFKRRVERGRIVDGHGDLHLEHIHIATDKVRIYDCIEFNERFRYGDLAADLAFLAMDLDFNNCWQEERYFVNQMAEKLEDKDLLRIIDFYKCYRAYVKGKVKSLQSAEEEVSKEERIESAELARRYFNLSLRYALLGSHPIVLIVMGRVGTGKSTLSKHLSEKLNINRYSSDYIRKSLAGLPLTERTPEKKRSSLYSREMSRKTYNTLKSKAEEAAKNGESVILDATFSRRNGREKMRDMLGSADIDFIFIENRAKDETIAQRLKQREDKNEVVSDARLEDFEHLSSAYEPPEEIDENHFLSVSTEKTVKESVRVLYKKLTDRNLAK